MADTEDKEQGQKEAPAGGPLSLLDSEAQEVAEQRKRLEALLTAIGAADAALSEKQRKLEEAKEKVAPQIKMHSDLETKVRGLEHELTHAEETVKELDFEHDEYQRKYSGVQAEIASLPEKWTRAKAKAQETYATRQRELKIQYDTEVQLARERYEAAKKAEADSITVKLRKLREQLNMIEKKLTHDLTGITDAKERTEKKREEAQQKYASLQNAYAALQSRLAEVESTVSDAETGLIIQAQEAEKQITGLLNSPDSIVSIAEALGYVKKEDKYVLDSGSAAKALPAPKREEPAAEEPIVASVTSDVPEAPATEDEEGVDEMIIEDLTAEHVGEIAANSPRSTEEPPVIIEEDVEEAEDTSAAPAVFAQPAQAESEIAHASISSDPPDIFPAISEEPVSTSGREVSQQFNISVLADQVAAEARARTPTPDPRAAPPASIVPQGIVRITEDAVARWRISYLPADQTSNGVESKSINYIDGQSFLAGLKQVLQTLVKETDAAKYDLEKLTQDDMVAISLDSPDFSNAFTDLRKALTFIISQYNRSIEEIVHDHVAEKQPITRESLSRISYKNRSLVLGDLMRDVLFGAGNGILFDLLTIEQLDRIFNDMPIPQADDAPQFIDSINLKQFAEMIDAAVANINTVSNYGHRTAAGLQAIEELAKYLGEK